MKNVILMGKMNTNEDIPTGIPTDILSRFDVIVVDGDVIKSRVDDLDPKELCDKYTQAALQPLKIANLCVGMKLRFSFPNNGWPMDRQNNIDTLDPDTIYTVSEFTIGGFHSSVCLHGMGTQKFNTVIFSEVKD